MASVSNYELLQAMSILSKALPNIPKGKRHDQIGDHLFQVVEEFLIRATTTNDESTDVAVPEVEEETK